MTEHSWPFYDGATGGTPVYEDQWSIMARMWGPSGVQSGHAGALEVYADSSGMTVKVRPGRAMVRGHCYDLDAETSLTIAGNSSGNIRIDYVVLRLDPIANSVLLTLLPGTPSAVLAPPSLTQTDVGVYDMPLATVGVPSGATSIAASQVGDQRVWTGVGVYKTWTPLVGASAGSYPAMNSSGGAYCQDGKRVSGYGYVTGFGNSGGGNSNDELHLLLPALPATWRISLLGRALLYQQGMGQISQWEMQAVAGSPYARLLRMSMPVNSPSTQLGDVIVWRRGQLQVYQVPNQIAIDFTFEYQAA